MGRQSKNHVYAYCLVCFLSDLGFLRIGKINSPFSTSSLSIESYGDSFSLDILVASGTKAKFFNFIDLFCSKDSLPSLRNRKRAKVGERVVL